MGLDMYLVVEKKSEHDKVYHEELAYWRKANQIHRWFVENVQSYQDDCMAYPVGRSHLEKLLNDCKQTLDNPFAPDETLPALHGPFFGSLDYDDWYFQDVNYTAQVCKTILGAFNFNGEERLLYYSLW